MAYEWMPSPNFKPGRTQPIKFIVIHWWDNPAKKPKLEGVLAHLRNPSVEVAAHYVVTGDRIIQLVKESDTAWHSRSANPYTIGIEVDPNVPGNTYKTVGRLVREIRQRHGDLPLKRHSDFVSTDCPGSLDIARIDREARTTDKEKEEMPTASEVTYVFKKAWGDNYQVRQDELDTYTTKPWPVLIKAVLEADAFRSRLVVTDAQSKAAKYDQLKELLR